MHTLQPDNIHDRWMWNCCEAALQANIASWQRRNTRLLEINCGRGLCLRLLWECGFDVTGTAASHEDRCLAALNAPHGTEVLAAGDDDIPVEADSFEWVILHLGAHNAVQTRRAVHEAARIASRGLLISFWNRSALLRPLLFVWRNYFRLPYRGQHLWQVWGAARDLPGRKRFSGCLPLPFMHGLSGFVGCAGRTCSALVGAWVMLRIDLDVAPRGTPLGLRLSSGRSLSQEGVAVLERRASGHQEQRKDELYVPERKSAAGKA